MDAPIDATTDAQDSLIERDLLDVPESTRAFEPEAFVPDDEDLVPAEAMPDEGEAPPSWFGERVQRWMGTAQAVVTVVAVAGAALFVFAQLHPDLLFSSTTPAGGDMGAHVWAPAYLRDHLLSKGRLTGWTPDWYAGFPAMQFYMVLPMLAIALLSYVIPYGIAFKLVTVLGVVTLPLSAYAFGRLTRQPFPVPALMSVAAALFVFDRSFSIYGGNAASTLAGEFAFSISLSLSILFLGVVGRGLTDGTHRALAAVLLAVTGLCHLIPTFFALAGAAIWFLVYFGRDLLEFAGSLAPDRRRALWGTTRARSWWLLTALPVGGMIAAFWVLPFYAKSRYLNDMGWEKKTDYVDPLFWRQNLGGGGLIDYPTIAVVLALALCGIAMSFALRNRGGLFFTGMLAFTAFAFRYVPQGRLWNTRILPFYYLCALMLAATALGLLPLLLRRVKPRRWVGGIALVATVGLQACLGLEPQPFEHDINWARPQWAAYVYVGIGLVVLIAAAELLAMPIRLRRRLSWMMVGAAALAQVVMTAEPETRTGVGLLGWTASLLVLVTLSAAIELVGPTGNRSRAWVPGALRLLGTCAVLAMTFLYLAMPMRSLGWFGHDELDGRYSFMGIDQIATHDDSFVDSWAAWNYRGYEGTCDGPTANPCARGRKRYFPEYHALVDTMQRVGDEHGCGRAMWEYSSELDRYGTPMAPMLLPHWTDGCIGSMEGLYFEASTTTPYHFINQDELSEAGSNAQRGMPYLPGAPTQTDFDRGIRHLQMLGVRYYLSYTPAMTALARANSSLTEIDHSPSVCEPEWCPEGVKPGPDRWVVFQVADSELVVPLTHEPVVLTGIGKGHTCDSVPIAEDPRGRKCKGWLDPSIDWYIDESLWGTPLAESGPDDWARVDAHDWMADHKAPSETLDPVQVSDISSDDDEVSFSVDQVGVPVLVRVSYFPNWKVEGAEGPYRVTPNLMVVIPTEKDVRLHYGYVPVDLVSWALTFAGLGLLVVLVRRGPITIPAGPLAEWHRPRRPALDSEPFGGGPEVSVSPEHPPDDVGPPVLGADESERGAAPFDG
jgi:hypothetical protein